jgi:hypothetical protein
MLPFPPDLEPGRIVRVRQRQYLIEEVFAPPAVGDCTLVRLMDLAGQYLMKCLATDGRRTDA